MLTLAMLFYLTLLLLMCPVGYIVSTDYTDDGCRSPQHLELGKNGTVSCYFSAGFYGIFWYNSTSYETDRPFLYYKEGEKTGRGYTSGEFDIHPNGSLVINNVSLEHDHFFTVVHIKRKEEADPETHKVRVVVTVKPKEGRPLIKQCKHSSQKGVCYIQSDGTFDLTCYVGDSRPRIQLMWVKRTLIKETNITFEAYYYTNGIVESSFVNTTYTFNNSECLVLLACKAVGDTTWLKTRESLVLAECPQASYFSDTPQIRYVEIDSSVTLECTHTENMLVVWKRHQENGGYKVVDFAVNTGNNASNTYISNHSLSHGNSLFIKDVSYEVEGLYSCVFGNGTNWGMAVFNVTVHAQPFSVILGIEDCDVSDKCEIVAHEGGSLTCKILGVHPIVQLAWVIMTEDPSKEISLFNESVSITQQTEVYDISLTVRYVIKDTQRKRITVKCKVSGPHAHIFPFERAADLVVSQDVSTEETFPTKTVADHSRKAIAAVVVPVLVLLVVVFTLFLVRRKVSRGCRENQAEPNSSEQEMDKMLPEETDIDELLDVMKTGLRGKYRSKYSNILPFLNTLEAAYSIKTIFVKCPIALLRPPKDRHHTDTWRKLESYNDIFLNDGFNSTRCIIKAYPGYGKTTLALKLACDWGETEGDSFVKDEDLFIYLRMSQLEMFSNIYQAIRSTLLPKDSPLRVNDIQKVLNSCNSLTIFFDDFEEYSDKSKFSSSDVLNIIKGEMFQNHKVIVTTRSFKFMKDHDITGDKVRLIGFDHSARKTYVDQVFENNTSDNRILQQLEKNPALRDLCEIPLFFAAFAHMPPKYAHFKASDNITKVVSYLMGYFVKHAQERGSKTKTISDRTMDNNEYCKLDKIAFESLVAGESNKEWLKLDLCGLIGEKLYKKCITRGILIQDERFLISDNPDNREQENYTYQTIVRFHHKILCEWHAAYYVVKKIKKGRNVAFLNESLNKLDPFSCELMYLFACGLYPEGTPQITAFLKDQPETYTLIMRCIYERSGDVGDIKDSLEKMCKDPVIFYNKESSLKQSTTLKLLDICSDSKINIAAVWCYNCIEHDNCSEDSLALESGAAIRILITLKELMLYSEGIKMNNSNVSRIFKYAAKCSKLVKLTIFGHLMPLTFTDGDHFVQLRERDVEVTWIPITKQVYTLDLGSCKWQDTEGESLEQDRYQELEVEFREFWNLDNEASQDIK